jgi:hypothetical protein
LPLCRQPFPRRNNTMHTVDVIIAVAYTVLAVAHIAALFVK